MHNAWLICYPELSDNEKKFLEYMTKVSFEREAKYTKEIERLQKEIEWYQKQIDKMSR